MPRMERDQRPVFRASVGEIVGSWLRVWTPRRDVYIPPVPVFRILLALVVLVGAIVVTAVLVENGKEAGRERDRRAEAVAVAQVRARIAREQVPRHARLGAFTADHAAAQGALQAAITRDSQQRFASHVLDARVTHTTCIPFVRPTVPHPPQPPPGARSGKYECLGVTSSIGPTSRTRGGDFGFPFWARVDFRHGTAVWCKINPRPGELGIGGDVFVPLAPQCDLLAR
jgi:hypothetical protein